MKRPPQRLHELLMQLRYEPMGLNELRLELPGWGKATLRAWLADLVRLGMIVEVPVIMCEGRSSPRVRYRLARNWMG